MSEFDQYLDLYLAEAQEHLDTLNRGILDLESGGGGGSLDEAFRAAHTIKGMSAMMGHDAVAAVAHRLEDRLDEVRAGRVEVDPELIDELLAGADALARAIDESATGGGGDADDDASETAVAASDLAPAMAVPDVEAPEGTEWVVRVVLSDDCQLKAARAVLIARSVARVCSVLATQPIAFDDAFDGEM